MEKGYGPSTHAYRIHNSKVIGPAIYSHPIQVQSVRYYAPKWIFTIESSTYETMDNSHQTPVGLY